MVHFLLFDYQDEFAGLPAIVPKGPLAIFGLVNLGSFKVFDKLSLVKLVF